MLDFTKYSPLIKLNLILASVVYIQMCLWLTNSLRRWLPWHVNHKYLYTLVLTRVYVEKVLQGHLNNGLWAQEVNLTTRKPSTRQPTVRPTNQATNSNQTSNPDAFAASSVSNFWKAQIASCKLSVKTFTRDCVGIRRIVELHVDCVNSLATKCCSRQE